MGENISLKKSLLTKKTKLENELKMLTEEYEKIKLTLSDNIFNSLPAFQQMELLKRQNQMEDHFYQLQDKITHIKNQLTQFK